MSKRISAPFGSWVSPITSDLIVSASISFNEVLLDGDDVYWIEGRPREAGRYVLVHRQADGTEHRDVTPGPFSVRTRVHDMGVARRRLPREWPIAASTRINGSTASCRA